MTAANLKLIYSRERIFRRFVLGVAALFVVYLYLINSVVFNLVGRQRALDKLNERQIRVVGLETEYLALSNKVTLELARALGFQDAAGRVIFARSLPLAGPVALVPPARR